MEHQRTLKRNRSWLKEEDDRLRDMVDHNLKPKQNWYTIARRAGLNRSANSCRLRWFNHLKPGCRPGKLTQEEKLLSLEFRSLFRKNCWAIIARHLLPGRRDNDIKNFWHTLAKRAKLGNGDVDSEAVVKRAELVGKITAAGKFSMDYSSLISKDAREILSGLFPDLDIAGGGAAAAVVVSSSTAGGADALISADAADIVGPTMEVRHEFPNPCWDSHIFPDNLIVQQQMMMGTADGPHYQDELVDWFSDYGGDQGGATGFNQPAAIWGASNDTGNPHNSYAEVGGAVNQWGPASAAARV